MKGIWVWRKDSASVTGWPDQGVLWSQLCGGVSDAWDRVCLEGVEDTTGSFGGEMDVSAVRLVRIC